MAVERIKHIAVKVLEMCGHEVPDTFTEALAVELTRQLGGERVYISSCPLDKNERDKAIRREFNGRNIRQMCEKYDLSRRSVYRIVNKK